MLSDSEDEAQNEELHQITINEHYAKAFQYRKEREELDTLKAKLGSDISESDIEEEETNSESAESEDEDGEELTPAMDAAILRTLARIRRKDPSIYESGKGIFEEEQQNLAARSAFPASEKNKRNLEKPVTLRQAALEAQLNPSRSPSPQPPTHFQEQAALRKETISVFHNAAEEDGGDEDDLLVLREKTKDEQEEEEARYRAFLEREVGDLKGIIGIDEQTKMNDEPVKDSAEGGGKKKDKKKNTQPDVTETLTKKHKSKEEEDQAFLVDYILNRGWIDKSKNRVPTYKEVTSSSKPKENKPSQPDSDSDAQKNDEANLSDSSFDSLVDTFETSYNFRFEEPNSSTIPSFPRSIPSLVRREDTTRKDARERRKKRKAEEMEKKREDVRRMKALKMREIRRKLEMIGREGGILGTKSSQKVQSKGDRWEDDDMEGEGGDIDVALREFDLEGDWDPAKHDQQMAGLFNEGGEGEDDWQDVGEVDENGKPVWTDDIDIGDINFANSKEEEVVPTPDKKKKKKKRKKRDEEHDYGDTGVDIDTTDADAQASMKKMDEEEEWDGTEEMRKRKLDEYMDEIYNLEFNDMVGDLPTHFKYVPVASQNYALSPVEILLATDKELNEFLGIKRYAPYRNDARKWDEKRQKRLRELKTILAERNRNGGWLVKGSSNTGGGTGSGLTDRGQSEGEAKPKKRKGKKERLKARAVAEAKNIDVDEGAALVETGYGENNSMRIHEGDVDSVGGKADVKNLKKKKRKELSIPGGEKGLEDSNGNGPKRKRDVAEMEVQELHQHHPRQESEDDCKPKKKRRRKHKKIADGHGENVTRSGDGAVSVE